MSPPADGKLGEGAVGAVAPRWLAGDHKTIARRFLWAGLAFLAVGGALALVIRWQWAFPGAVAPHVYPRLFTAHGLIMIYWAATPILLGALGNFCLPLMIGAREMAFPGLSTLSFRVFLASGLILLASFLVPLGGAAAGWTMYPPLSTGVGSPGAGQTLVAAAVLVAGLATLLGAINAVTTVVLLRAPGMTLLRMPLTVWGLWLAAILNVLFAPVLAAACLLLLLDRVSGTQFFVAGATAAGGGGDPILYQHLFWIFGHPEVYILILPAWGIVGDLLSFFARKPAAWYRGTVGAMVLVTVLSAVVYGHHLYVTGMQPLIGAGFEALTLLISAPAVLLVLNWLHTLWGGAIRLATPMLFALGTVLVFGLGGLTGLLLGTMSTDVYLHDTMYVVGHFHLTMAASVFLASLAAIYFWFPKMYGCALDERLGKAHFWASAPLLMLVFSGQLVAGYCGQPRRFRDPFGYAFLEHLRPLNFWTSMAAFAFATAQLLFVVNVAVALRRRRPASANPWSVGTLEWTCASPPPPGNFADVPRVHRGPHELGRPELRARLGRDWIAQDER